MNWTDRAYRETQRSRLEMTAMELEDCACPSVRSVVVCCDRPRALAGAHLLLILNDDSLASSPAISSASHIHIHVAVYGVSCR